MSKINVVFATDANYLDYLEIVLKSLLAHNENLYVFVMNTGDIPEEWENKLQPYFERRDCVLKLVNFRKSCLEDFNPHAHISPAGYLRFYIDSLFQISKNPYWIYLDCDIVINGDITEPFRKYNFSNYALGAVSDLGVNTYKQFEDHPYKNKDYFNSGVLYLNAIKLLEDYQDFSAELRELVINLQDETVMGDQDILNYYFKDDWIKLSNCYNTQLENLFFSEREKEILQPTIIHFTGKNKPLGEINTNSQFATSVISLFRLYNQLSWENLVNMPLGTITLKLGD